MDDSTDNYDTLKEDVLNHWALKVEDAKCGIETPPVPQLGIYGELESSAMLLLEEEEPPPPPGTNTGGGSSTNSGLAHASYTSNQLYLEIITITNDTAALTIHPPWYARNGVYDLGYCTDLTPTIDWQWVLRTEPGQTDLVVTNATDEQGFYGLRPLDDLPPDDSLGTNFWLAFYTTSDGFSDLSLYISSQVGATGRVTIPGFAITNNFSVAAGGVTNVSVTNSAMIQYYEYNMKGTNGIHVIASQPVAVYALVYQPEASTAFTGYPTRMLGTNYCVLAYPGPNYQYLSQFAVVATENNTSVTITPSSTANLLGSTTNLTLQEGQSYQNRSSASGSDVTGTRIESDKPIAVFAGARFAYVPANTETEAANPVVQQQLPVDWWGTNALGLSFAGRTDGDTYRVLAAYNDTVVWTNGVMVATNQASGFTDLIIDGPVEFQGSKPIQVAQFANGTDFDSLPNNYGDPCEMVLPPAGHWLATNVVYTPTGPDSYGNPYDFTTNYLNIIVVDWATNSTYLDVTNAITNFVAVGTNGYFGARIVVATGTYTVSSSQPVGVQVYGFGSYDAYGYFGGVVK